MTGNAVHACASLHLVTGAEDLVPFAPQHQTIKQCEELALRMLATLPSLPNLQA